MTIFMKFEVLLFKTSKIFDFELSKWTSDWNFTSIEKHFANMRECQLELSVNLHELQVFI